MRVKRKKGKKNSTSIYGGISAITGKSLTYFCYWQNSKETIAFLEEVKKHRSELIEATKSTPKPILVIWDNASHHKSQEIKDWLTENPGIVELFNFPPYCPELNPQEHVWKALKQHLTSIKTYSMKFEEIVVAAKAFMRKDFQYKLL